MKKKIEAFTMEFLKGLKDSDYQLIYDYDKIQTCIEVICLRDSFSYKAKFKFFKFIGSEQILIQMNREILYNYMIRQNGSKFELYELTMKTYNHYERKVDEIVLRK